jgi:predicted pyridoxine 5'-phosphate oxidase superfamily flavin-nucleotide-binding protein
MRFPSRVSASVVRCALACTAFLAACQEPTVEHDPIAGVFVLRTVGSAPIPTVTGSALDVEFIVLADTVVLHADGSGEQRRRTVRRNLTTDARDTSYTLLQFDHQRRGDRVRTMNITCEPTCDVLPGVAEYLLDNGWLVLGPDAMAHRYESVGPSGAL